MSIPLKGTLRQSDGSWARERGAQLRLIEPGKPDRNAYIESFNRRLRDEFLMTTGSPVCWAHTPRLDAGDENTRGTTEEGTRRTDTHGLCQTAH